MQIQSPAFTYQTPTTYAPSPYSSPIQQNSGMNQAICAPQGQTDRATNLLYSILSRVLDFAFSLLTQLIGGQGSNVGFKSGLLPTDAASTTGVSSLTQSAAPEVKSDSLWDSSKNLFNTVTTALGISELFSGAVNGMKKVFSGGLQTAAKIGGAIASIF